MKKYVQFVSLVMAVVMAMAFTTVAMAADSAQLPEGIDWVEMDIQELIDESEAALGYRPSFHYYSEEEGNGYLGYLEIFLPNKVTKVDTYYCKCHQTLFGSQEQLNQFKYGDCESNRNQYNLLVLQATHVEDDVQYFTVNNLEVFGRNNWYVRVPVEATSPEGSNSTVIKELKSLQVLPDGTVVVDEKEINELVYRANLN